MLCFWLLQFSLFLINSPICMIKYLLKKINNNSQRAVFSLIHTQIWLRYVFRKREGVQNYFKLLVTLSQLGSSPRALSIPQKLWTSSLHQSERSFSTEFSLEVPILSENLGKTSEIAWEWLKPSSSLVVLHHATPNLDIIIF